MAKKKGIRLNAITVMLIAVVLIVIAGLAASGGIPNGFQEVFDIKLPLPLAIIPVENIFCQFKVQSFQNFIDGTTESVHSPFTEGSPVTTLDVFEREGEGIKVSNYEVFPKIRCFNPDGEGDQNIQIKPSTLSIDVYATDKDGERIKVYSTSLRTTERFSSGNEVVLGSKQIPALEVSNDLQDGKYNTDIEIRTFGRISMVYEDFDFPSVTYEFIVPETQSRTFFQAFIDQGASPPMMCPQGEQFDANNVCRKLICEPPLVLVGSSCAITDPNPCNENQTLVTTEGQQFCVDVKPPEKDGGIGDIFGLPFADFLACATSGETACLNDAKFITIYALVLIIVLLAAVASRGGK